jgi:predicted nucleic acid binding AN1-type Zn finger protein
MIELTKLNTYVDCSKTNQSTVTQSKLPDEINTQTGIDTETHTHEQTHAYISFEGVRRQEDCSVPPEADAKDDHCAGDARGRECHVEASTA